MPKSRLVNTAVGTLLLFMLSISSFVCSVKAMNSFVTPEGIRKMKAAKIDTEIISLLAIQQTCVVSPDLLVRLKHAGADSDTLRGIIVADRHKQPNTARLSTEEIEILKEAGCSDEMILRLLGKTAVETVVDAQGNETVIYRTDVLNPPKGEDGQECLDVYDIYIENLEKN